MPAQATPLGHKRHRYPHLKHDNTGTVIKKKPNSRVGMKQTIHLHKITLGTSNKVKEPQKGNDSIIKKHNKTIGQIILFQQTQTI